LAASLLDDIIVLWNKAKEDDADVPKMSFHYDAKDDPWTVLGPCTRRVDNMYPAEFILLLNCAACILALSQGVFDQL
jgi:hypothetical protein